VASRRGLPFLYQSGHANRSQGCVEDVALVWGCAVDLDGKAKAGMGVHATDVDDDGGLDIIVAIGVNHCFVVSLFPIPRTSCSAPNHDS
jgi:hypothetical protein